ncbi:Uncharacterised protein [Streptococcus pneumoniae]|nr:Uncharacterised protein [Streptococcus pneumoniae]CKV87440.1 Uncharacterised protein [Mycobacterium tuberculosis]
MQDLLFHFYSYRLNLTLFFFELLICLLNSEFDLSKFIFVYFDEYFHEDSLKMNLHQFSFSF